MGSSFPRSCFENRVSCRHKMSHFCNKVQVHRALGLVSSTAVVRANPHTSLIGLRRSSTIRYIWTRNEPSSTITRLARGCITSYLTKSVVLDPLKCHELTYLFKLPQNFDLILPLIFILGDGLMDELL